MNNLKKIVKALKKNQKQNKNTIYNYSIPDVWNTFGYEGEEMIVLRNGECIVNPYSFFTELIEGYLLSFANKKVDYSAPYHVAQKTKLTKKSVPGDWIRRSTLYSTMIRTSGAWDGDRSHDLETSNIYHLKDTGTFIKTMAMLPTLKKMGIDVIYMLPISKFSLKDKKGELGSPYGVSNFYKLDENLHDPLVGEEMNVEEEFKAFVEACHLLDMKVIIDIIPRTNSVNSDLILEHPDWFYWIPKSEMANYKSPAVPTLGPSLAAKPEYVDAIYSSPEVIEHIRKFSVNPKQLDPKKWEALLKEYHSEHNTLEILDLIQKHYDITIAPAFSDCINDPQPAWSDVTYFRLYLDNPTNAQPYLEQYPDLAPYILFDVAKASLNPGSVKNQPLWDILADIIPHYQRSFGIDGARIDMGHALPDELIANIIHNARAIDPHFTFIAEELDAANAAVSAEKGYNCIIGDGFTRLPRVYEGKFNSFVYSTSETTIPMFAVGETHDTPRLAARNGGETLSRLVTAFNMFTPNTIPFINCGQEVFEIQPMNTGLDCRENEAFLLPENDLFYGKLALFDKYALHYTHPKRMEMIEMISKMSEIRQKYLDVMLESKYTFPLSFNSPWDLAAGFAYGNKKSTLVVVANTDVFNWKTHNIHFNQLPESFFFHRKIRQVASNINVHAQYDIHFDYGYTLTLDFQPGEVKVLEIY
ncbi:MAG: alpha-amylase family glycosyl hydrolase [Erysipelotrichaceae bacterium]